MILNVDKTPTAPPHLATGEKWRRRARDIDIHVYHREAKPTASPNRERKS